MAVPLALGHPIGARAPCWQRIPKGTRCLGSGFQGRRRCLGGRHPMEGSAFRGRKNPMKPAVSWHTTLFAKSSVLYLWRPWVTERGCSGQEQALSVSHRTGGFCVLPDEKPRSLLKAESACSGVGGAAKWKGKAKRSLAMERHHRGSQRDIKPSSRRSDASFVTLEMQSSSVSEDHSDRS